ncbi:hypothetical protein HGRIS_012356 [Hohenbuehelia grisea]|uniref:Xylanolytic transcriptional activator regulatory domain-containing protein n=1 Tax=Hohenbuehelia grisea TaxID=104357 RepID=A0ABR3IS36_9AGAR
MTKMEARMHSLEDALAIVQATESDEPHPLLTESWDEGDEAPQPPEDDDVAATLDALGMLHIDDKELRFFGPSGGSESLLLKAKQLEAQGPLGLRPRLQDLDTSLLPPEINQLCRSFPFTPAGISTRPIQTTIESYLPSIERAIELCDTFLQNLSWLFHIISRQQVVNELIPAVYQISKVPYGPHDLALLLIVLGVGAMLDLKLSPYNLEAQYYYHLGRAALTLQPVLAEQSIATIKALHLMSIYNGLSGKETNMEQSYTLLNFAGRVALAIGFHTDPSLWGFEGKEAYDRRVYFWNLLSSSLWQSLITGRPPIILDSFYDCKIPTSEEEERYQRGEVPVGFGVWGFKLTQACLFPAVRATLAVKPPPYSTILDLDRKIRDFASVPPLTNAREDDIALSMRAFVRSHYQDLILLFLHRGYFAEAMTENPDAPFSSTYGRSVTAAYHSACVVLEDTRLQFVKKPMLCARVWRIWSHAFSAAVVIGAVAIREKQLNISPPAFEQFELACLLFQKAAETNSRAARGLPILLEMQQKARQAREWPGQLRADITSELEIFGGRSSTSSPSADVPGPSTPTAKAPLHRSSTSAESRFQAFTGPPLRPSSATDASRQPDATPSPSVTAGWDSLYSELSQRSARGAEPEVIPQGGPRGAGSTFDVRWSTFMDDRGPGASPQPPRP